MSRDHTQLGMKTDFIVHILLHIDLALEHVRPNLPASPACVWGGGGGCTYLAAARYHGEELGLSWMLDTSGSFCSQTTTWELIRPHKKAPIPRATMEFPS